MSRTFREAMLDESHFQFFHRFLKSRHNEALLDCWKAVSALKKDPIAGPARKKLIKSNILKQYFTNGKDKKSKMDVYTRSCISMIKSPEIQFNFTIHL